MEWARHGASWCCSFVACCAATLAAVADGDCGSRLSGAGVRRWHFLLFSLSADNDVVPDGAKSFVKALQRSIRAGGAKGEAAGGKSRGDLATLYDSEFPKLTERYFKASSWPAADAIGQFIEDGQNAQTDAMRSSILSVSFSCDRAEECLSGPPIGPCGCSGEALTAHARTAMRRKYNKSMRSLCCAPERLNIIQTQCDLDRSTPS